MMKKAAMIFFFLSMAFYINGQEDKLKFHSGTVGIGIFDMNPYGSGNLGGLTVHLDGTWRLRKHLYSLGSHFGSEVVFPVGQFQDYHIAYGREIRLNDRIILDAFAGLGYLLGVYDKGFEYVTRKTMGLPLKASLYFFLGEHFAIVLHPYINVNTFSIIYSGSFSLCIKI